MRIDIPQGQYLKKLETVENGINVEFGTPKKIALLFICLNANYWPYVAQVIKDCRKFFLKNHQVDYFVWTDFNEENKRKQLTEIDSFLDGWFKAPTEKKSEVLGSLVGMFVNIVRLYEHFYAPQITQAIQELNAQGVFIKRDGPKFWLECVRPVLSDNEVRMIHAVARNILMLGQSDVKNALEGTTVIDTDAVPWPSPTLMRYHLFLNEEEKLKDYDYLFYMDADMRVVSDVGDEIMGDGLTAALHPMYALRSQYVPPYEPNKNSTAYIPRPGKVIDEGVKQRFTPYYYAGGFQGGTADSFLEAMRTMKVNIDKDFDNNYIAIWNDESHWNKFLFEKEPDVVLSPSYVYPDSLVKEYYVPLWGRDYEPKIITLTKPFTLSSEGAAAIQEMIKK